MKLLSTALACAALLLPASNLIAQDNTYKLVVDYDRPGLAIPHWQITVPPRGPAQYIGAPEKGIDPGTVLFPISQAGRNKLGDTLARSKNLQPCETKSKGIANMGAKTFAYTPAGGPTSTCTYNFTENKALTEAFDYVMAVANTVQAGLEMERLHRYNRLGLDPLMLRLVEDVKNNHAVELGAIRPTLESLLTDPALLERVRTRAQQLLDLAKQQDAATN